MTNPFDDLRSKLDSMSPSDRRRAMKALQSIRDRLEDFSKWAEIGRTEIWDDPGLPPELDDKLRMFMGWPIDKVNGLIDHAAPVLENPDTTRKAMRQAIEDAILGTAAYMLHISSETQRKD